MINAGSYLRAISDRLEQESPEASDLLPTILVLACVDVLPVDGAGLSVMSNIRLPLGSSDQHASFIERLQFSTGTGPCLTAVELGEPLVTNEDRIAAAWPTFHGEMIAKTPYRSTMSMPVSVAGFTGALNLYSSDASGATFPPVEEVFAAVARPIRALTMDPSTSRDRLGVELPVWMVNHAIDVRLDVWVAAGMIMQSAGYTSVDALATLRGYAYSRSRTLDEVSSELISRDLSAAEVVAG